MRRFVVLLVGLVTVLAIQLPAFAGNDTEVCQTHGGKHEKTKTIHVNSHALPAFIANGSTEGACGTEPPADDPPADEEPPADDEPTGNAAPVAYATYTVTSGFFGQIVHLDGSGSSDADGDSLTHRWDVEEPDGDVVTYIGPTVQFMHPGSGTMVTLTVSDGTADDQYTFVIE